MLLACTFGFQSLLLLLVFLLHGISAWPFVHNGTVIDNESYKTGSIPIADLKRRAGGFYLRIMPLGASITYGYLSSDGNGYRKALREQLRYAGWEVNMVGEYRAGSMADNDVEAHSGDIITQIGSAAENTIGLKPNLVLINAGTNDCVGSIDIANAHNRMGTIIDRLFDAIPGTTVILSTLLPNANAVTNANKEIYNNDLRNDVIARRAKGQNIVLAEMDDGFIVTGDLQDGTHPTDYGYTKLSAVFWQAIQEADKAGFLTAPADTGKSDTQTSNACAKVYGVSRGPVQTQRGSGSDDGGYVHSSINEGAVTTFNRDTVPDGFWFANVYGGTDVLLEFTTTSDGTVNFQVFNNNGNGWTETSNTINTSNNCKAKGVHWGDFNADGVDDYFCIGAEGNLYVSINDGSGNFHDIGLVMTHPDGYDQSRVRLADIDGDGRIDYCVIADNGDINAWRNGGQGDAPDYWQDLGVVFTGKGKGDIDGVRFIDLNGDGRSDWLWMDDTGQVSTYINQRGCDKGLVPDWQDAGVTHAGMGVAGARANVYFSHVYVAKFKSSYVYITHDDDGKYSVNLWKNVGVGGTYLKGDGNHYCDMTGDGFDDYVWISPNGQGTLYQNTQSPPTWGQDGVIFDLGLDRKSLHLADMDGDGKCDIVQVIKDTGAINVWRNDYTSAGGFKFTSIGGFGGSATCTQGWGIGLYDLGLRFADITGDGKADYLCMEKDGRTTGFLNNGQNNFQDVGQIKYSVGKDRANHRWADVNGDGLADFLWIDKFDGDTSVWLNAGPIPASGSAFTWNAQGPLYEGPAEGACMHFPSLGGLKRADFHQVIARTNLAYTWYNECSDSGGGDDGTVSDPDLPNPPVTTITPTSPTSTAAATPTATDSGSGDCPGSTCASTGDPSDPNEWKSATCTFSVITDASTAPTDRWSGVYCENAWTAAVKGYNDHSGGLVFSEAISNFFNGPESLNCGLTADSNGCNSYIECDDTNYPAGYLIINSFVTVDSIVMNFYDAISRVETKVTAAIHNIASTFAPIPQESFSLKLALDLVSLGYALAAAPMWNSVLKGLPFFKTNSNTLGTLKDTANSLVSNGVTLAKDSANDDEDELGTENELEDRMSAMVDIWYKATDQLNQQLFNASSESIKLLHTLVQDGQMMENSYTPLSDNEIQLMLEKALFSILIPSAWQMQQPDTAAPVVLDAQATCGTNDPLKDYANTNKIANYICYDDQMYLLVGAQGDAYSCPSSDDGGIGACTDNFFTPLPGQDQFDGNAWGGLIQDDFVIGAVNSYVANGKANGGAQLDVSAVDGLSDLYDLSVRAPGVIQIPVCTAVEAFQVWTNHIDSNTKKNANYPCKG